MAYATREEQVLVSLKLEAGATVRQAIERSGIPQRFPEIAPAGLTAGIFGRVTPPDTLLRDGDRVEIYRPIAADPKDARHRRVARAKRTRAR